MDKGKMIGLTQFLNLPFIQVICFLLDIARNNHIYILRYIHCDKSH